MNYLTVILVFIKCITFITCLKCNIKCPNTDRVECGLDMVNSAYKLFTNACSMKAYSRCTGDEYIPVPLSSCVRRHNSMIIRKMYRSLYDEVCPTFCPEYYRPVCGVSQLRDYDYRTFRNGCYLDLVNCRGIEDFSYQEVSLKFCQNHYMKNIFTEQLITNNMKKYKEFLSRKRFEI
ncbi:PREDICTED: uncharacterized protein LOC106126645 [Papilio xuthus]|uniref:Uncharacterized protein LOC106126645 n=1 Tax=Papilio xuthus TaxID=66420 RepID=A0AAJ6ZV74_PAPXU|nr:PREDICTED: uncharacterized protein LOC106126645 [Papilio xuthus]